MTSTHGYEATAPGAPLTATTIERRELRPDDVEVRVSYCGVCHSDLHMTSAPGVGYPVTPGHEFVGEVSAVGPDVTAFAVGDPVAVGNIVDSCGDCTMCRAGQQNYCAEFPTLTYGGTDRIDGTTTRGAYAGTYVVRDAFVHHRPPNLDAAAVAPLLCAGITVWEPLRAWHVGPGTRLGVVGLGGLGHLAVKFGHALGAEVTVFTTTADKAGGARALGADRVVVSSDTDALAAEHDRHDVVLDTVAVEHDLSPYLRTVAMDGTLVLVGHLGEVTVDVMELLVGRKRLASSGTGGIPRTREMLDFCSEHGIVADVEVLPSAQVNEAFARLRRGDVRYRFALDLGDLGS